MTIIKPEKNFLDTVLSWFGKEREVIYPEDINEIHKKYGQHAQIKAKRGSFWKALFRKKKQDA